MKLMVEQLQNMYLLIYTLTVTMLQNHERLKVNMNKIMNS